MSPSDPGLLADLCAGAVKFACALGAERATDAETLAARCERALDDFSQRAARAGTSEQHLQLALYALCAWIDERVLHSDLPARRGWAANPLQLRRFDDLAAGDEFYAKLESLRASREPGAVDALEVYALCLALGFRGKLATAPERHRLLLEQLAAEIAQARRVTLPSPPPCASPPPRSARSAVWLAPLAAVLGALLCCALVHAWSDRAVDALSTIAAEVTHGP